MQYYRGDMAKNGKLPKRIAGVKIPKKLRKSGGKVQALMETPVIGHVIVDLLAVGLLAAADSIAASSHSSPAAVATWR